MKKIAIILSVLVLSAPALSLAESGSSQMSDVVKLQSRIMELQAQLARLLNQSSTTASDNDGDGQNEGERGLGALPLWMMGSSTPGSMMGSSTRPVPPGGIPPSAMLRGSASSTDIIGRMPPGFAKPMEKFIDRLGAQGSTTPPGIVNALDRHACLELLFSVRRSMSGDAVEKLQTFLASISGVYDNGPITGMFGPMTEQAVKRFQRMNHIEDTGLVGPKTRQKIREMSCGAASAIRPPAPPMVQLGTTSATTTNPQ